MPFISSVEGAQGYGRAQNTVQVNPSLGSILEFARQLSSTYTVDVSPTSGGALSINSESVGNYDYTVRSSDTIISTFTTSEWFTLTQDTVSAWIIVKGNLTINSGQVVIPSVRKLFTVVYCTGNLTVNGSISMTARGANHSGIGSSGGATPAVNIRIGTGIFSSITNPLIPAAGGAGAPARSNGLSNNGSPGTNGGSGGGGTGECISGTTASAGAAGTCFSGGPGSGGAISGTSTAGGANGGRGGNSSGSYAGGGAGNPGGSGSSAIYNGFDGTGGTLIVICEGTLSGSGSIAANGVGANRPPGGPAGGGSGGGSVTVLYQNDSSTITPTATGGAGVASGSGGNGTARKLDIGVN
jgi:hypothetical protein